MAAVPAASRREASTALWLLGGLRLVLEWAMVPLFAIALQVRPLLEAWLASWQAL
jgi:hypothetical protein